jgi:predicted DNA-binding transcriptional regulator AlpA
MTTATPSVQPRRLADARHVAALLGISARHVFRLADAGKMPRPLRLGSAVRWDLDMIEKWISSGCPSCREGGRK